jgi:hypothetical protein
MTSFDLYPLETLANKKRFLPELAEKNALLVFTHGAAVPWARVANLGGKITTQPVE